MAEDYERLQRHLDEETKFYQEQTSQNMAVMTDMQDTNTQLRNQLAELSREHTVRFIGGASRPSNLTSSWKVSQNVKKLRK